MKVHPLWDLDEIHFCARAAEQKVLDFTEIVESVQLPRLTLGGGSFVSFFRLPQTGQLLLVRVNRARQSVTLRN